jgi:hypothetical protein
MHGQALHAHCGFTEAAHLKWFNHLSRHCLPVRPGIFEAMIDHLRSVPNCFTSCSNSRCSSIVHLLTVRVLPVGVPCCKE